MPVTGDYMSPTARRLGLVKPMNKIVGEGTYVYDDGYGPVMTNVQLMMDRIRLFSENSHYTDHYLPASSSRRPSSASSWQTSRSRTRGSCLQKSRMCRR
jgi:hypothetical protein